MKTQPPNPCRSRVHTSFLLALTLAVAAGIAHVRPASAYEIHVNCGSGSYTAQDGTPFVADRVYAPTTFGYIEGWEPPQPTWHTIGGTADVALYQSTRNSFLPNGVLEYRFDVPNGPYLVTLHCSDNFKHSTGENQFDVLVEGLMALSNIDLYAQVQGTYAIDFTLATTVSDGVLNVIMDPDLGFTSLAAISVVSRAPDAVAPAMPTGVLADENYLGVALDWPAGPEDDLLGYQVERATSPGGPYTLVTPTALRVSRYMNPAAVGGPYYYRVQALDAFGNVSSPSAVVNGSSLAHSASTLPVVQIVIDAANLETLNDNPSSDTYVPCQIALGPQLFPTAEGRYRGNISRSLLKKSWKVKLGNGASYLGRETFNFNGEYIDKSLMRSALSYEVLARNGCPAPEMSFVHMVVNNAWMGVRTDAENINRAFLERVGLASENATLYKPAGLPELPPSHLVVLPDTSHYRAAYEKELGDTGDYSDLIQFIEGLNFTSPDSAFIFLARKMDLNRLLDYYSSEVVLQNTDITFKSWLLHHDLTKDRWTLIPWDTDLTFGNTLPFGSTSSAVESIFLGAGNRLFSKIQTVPILRQLHFDRIRQIFVTTLAPQNLNPMVDSTYAVVQTDAERDWWKWGWESNTWLHGQTTEIKAFAPARSNYLLTQIANLETPPNLIINELMAANQTAVTDEWGEFDDWVELSNRGSVPVSLNGLYLTDDLLLPGKFALPDTTLPPNGRALIWCDNQIAQGPWHANFKLEQNGEKVGLYPGALPTSQPLDVRVFDAQYTDASFGRLPDGSPFWAVLADPTPGAANAAGGNIRPQITNVSHFPFAPPAQSPVRVNADLWDDGTLVATELRYDAGSGFVTTNLLDDGLHGDGAGGDGTYGAFIPGQPASTVVSYYVRAADDLGAVTLDPPGAPAVTHSFTTGYVAPPLYLNEFMASNATTIPDEMGEFDDWLEIWNGGPSAIDLTGMHLTDNLSNPTKWVFPPVSLDPDEYLIVWCDEDGQQGPLHANFQISAAGEELGLFDSVTLGVA